MRFSIVTPNYNYGRFLKKSLESVLAQTDAINKGLRRATGDVVAWLNADEYYLPGKLALVAAAFAKHPDADFLYGEPLFVDKGGMPIRIKRDHPFSRFVLLYYGCHISSCASFWRRTIQTEEGIFLDPAYKVAMDYEFYCHVCRAGRRFRFVPATIAAFTWHDANVSAAFNDARIEEEFRTWLRYGRLPGSERARRRLWIPFVRRLAHQWHRLLVLFRLARFPHGA